MASKTDVFNVVEEKMSLPTSSLWRGSARAARDEARRRQLLDAALELYGTVGYRTTTVQAVCRHASVSSRSFYELYAQQEQLLTELYRELNSEVLEGLRTAPRDENDDLASTVHGMVSSALDPMLRDERRANVLEIESVGVSDELERHRREAYRTFAGAIDDAFCTLQDAGLIEAAPVGLSSLILVGGITEAIVQSVQTPQSERMTTEEFLAQITAVVLRMLA